MSFTVKQREAFSLMMSGENVFLSGEAGTGKSYVINQFLKEKRGQNILVTAPTGIAAINVDGITLHRAFKAPTEVLIGASKDVPKVVAEADVIIIDEISMCRIDLFDYVAKIILNAQKKRRRKIQVIVVGDFFQLPPVILPKEKEILDNYYGFDVGEGFAFLGTEWKNMNFKTILLNEVVRQKDKKFVTYLNKARIGDKSCIDFLNKNHHLKEINDSIILSSTNREVAKINEKKLKNLKGKEFSFYSEEQGEVKASDRPTEKVLRLKVGARVILLVNDKDMRYQNGSLATIKKIDIKNESITVLVNGNAIEIDKYKWSIEDSFIEEAEDGRKRLVKKEIGYFKQFPVRLAYAITIHKSQGQTYEKVNIDPYCWASGQLYVALSRAKSLKNMHLITPIKEEYLVVSKNVIGFYNGLFDENLKSKKKNRNDAIVTEKKDDKMDKIDYVFNDFMQRLNDL